MSAAPTLLIGRCSFWPEARDPEAWLRALTTLSQVSAKPGTQSWTSPRTVGETVLRGRLSRRGVPGLFGLQPGSAGVLAGSAASSEDRSPTRMSALPARITLLGVGLLEWNAACSSWRISADGQELLAAWHTADHRLAMGQLALLLLRRSAWLRLALFKLRSGVWHLLRWDRLKTSNGQLRVGDTLLLGNDTDPIAWLSGIEEIVLGAWWPELPHESPVVAQVDAPKTAHPDDGLSLSPLKSPLYLLDSLGWLDSAGHLRLPPAIASDPFLRVLAGPTRSPSVLLDQSTAAFSDHRGVFPLEPVMQRFASELGTFPQPAAHDSAFIAWTDQLLSESFRTGVIELLSAEPGQPRHGRGLFGDSKQKLLRWRVHEGFDDLCTDVSSAFREPSIAVCP